ncbi:MAG: hypothetical protein VX642_04960 [Bdellovibrionota bacterium]|nr:hypothetical protein [Bdellovibrionota bacterium]
MKNVTLIKLFSLCILLGACSDQKVSPLDRSMIADQNKEVFQKPIYREMQDPLASSDISACQLMGINLDDQNQIKRFSLFDRFEKSNDSLLLRSNIANSPFMLFYIGEVLSLPTEEEFYQLAKSKYEKGELSWMKWKLLKNAYAYWPSKYRDLMFSAVSDEIALNYPGIFGKMGESKNSLFFNINRKALQFNLDHSMNLDYGALTHNMALFSSDSWKEIQKENEQIYASLIQNFYYNKETSERNCASVLAQRMFAQLLSVKGYMGPEYKEVAFPHLKALSDEHPNFSLVPFFGAFMDENGPMVLGADDIANYNPAKNKMSLLAPATSLKANGKAQTLNSRIHFFRNMIQAFRFASPAESWVKPEAYLLGDISNPQTGILPVEASSLSLGFTTMELKNIAADSLFFINADGTSLKSGESTAGALLGTKLENDILRIRLEEVAEFTNAIVFLERALEKFKSRPAEEWQNINSVFSLDLLASLLGNELLSEDQLPASFDQAETLIAQLKKLYMPLAQMLVKLKTDKYCASELNYDLTTSDINIKKLCDAKDSQLLKTAKQNLAIHVDSPLLYEE